MHLFSVGFGRMTVEGEDQSLDLFVDFATIVVAKALVNKAQIAVFHVFFVPLLQSPEAGGERVRVFLRIQGIYFSID